MPTTNAITTNPLSRSLMPAHPRQSCQRRSRSGTASGAADDLSDDRAIELLARRGTGRTTRPRIVLALWAAAALASLLLLLVPPSFHCGSSLVVLATSEEEALTPLQAALAARRKKNEQAEEAAKAAAAAAAPPPVVAPTVKPGETVDVNGEKATITKHLGSGQNGEAHLAETTKDGTVSEVVYKKQGEGRGRFSDNEIDATSKAGQLISHNDAKTEMLQRKVGNEGLKDWLKRAENDPEMKKKFLAKDEKNVEGQPQKMKLSQEIYKQLKAQQTGEGGTGYLHLDTHAGNVRVSGTNPDGTPDAKLIDWGKADDPKRYLSADAEHKRGEEKIAMECQAHGFAFRSGHVYRRAAAGSAECKKASANAVAKNMKSFFAEKKTNADGTTNVKATLDALKKSKNGGAAGKITKDTIAKARGEKTGAGVKAAKKFPTVKTGASSDVKGAKNIKKKTGKGRVKAKTDKDGVKSVKGKGSKAKKAGSGGSKSAKAPGKRPKSPARKAGGQKTKLGSKRTAGGSGGKKKNTGGSTATRKQPAKRASPNRKAVQKRTAVKKSGSAALRKSGNAPGAKKQPAATKPVPKGRKK